MTKHLVTFSPQVRRVLKNLANGGGLRWTRVFPFPREYILRKLDNSGDYSGRISIDTVATLVEHKLVDPRASDAKGDFGNYILTDLGQRAAETGSLGYDDENREMFT